MIFLVPIICAGICGAIILITIIPEILCWIIGDIYDGIDATFADKIHALGKKIYEIAFKSWVLMCIFTALHFLIVIIYLITK